MVEFLPGMVDSCPNALQGTSHQMFLTLVNALLTLKCEFGPEGRYPPDYGPKLKDGDEFDFIVVGSGSAGSVVANRLSEVPQWRVLLLEAGGYPSAITEIPGLASSVQKTNEDWQYHMTPSNTSCMGIQSNPCLVPRGKGLGGSSIINTMFYTRATKFDHENWFAGGNNGWDYGSVLQNYKNNENAHVTDNDVYGSNGELHLTRYTSVQPVRSILSAAYNELGYHTYTEDTPIGVRDNLMAVYKGTRMSSSKSFIAPVKNRTNLYVAINAHVNKIIVDENTLTAQGVQVNIHNKIIHLKTKKEVILSAGSINSPLILINSGIGPRDHLSSLGIKLTKDLRVGHNFQDHFSFPGIIVKLDNKAVISPGPSQMLDELFQYFAHRKGELTTLGLLNFGASVNTYNKTTKANVQFFHKLVPNGDLNSLQAYLDSKGYPNEAVKSLLQHSNSTLLFFVSVLLNPKSRGAVRLQNATPFAKPSIVPNFLSDKNGEDMQVLLDSIKFVQRLTKTRAFAPYNPKILDLDIGNCRTFKPQSREFWECAIRNIGSTSYHPVGTCKMGPKSDPEAVVNPRLQVHGIKGIRVIDGSVMPTITSTNPSAPIMMIGDRGASLIKEDWLGKQKIVIV